MKSQVISLAHHRAARANQSKDKLQTLLLEMAGMASRGEIDGLVFSVSFAADDCASAHDDRLSCGAIGISDQQAVIAAGLLHHKFIQRLARSHDDAHSERLR